MAYLVRLLKIDNLADAVVIAATLTSGVIMVVNLLIRFLLGQIATKVEQPCAKSALQTRLLTIAATVYVCNYVLVIYVAHSPLAGNDYTSVLVNTAINRSHVISEATAVGGCNDIALAITDHHLNSTAALSMETVAALTTTWSCLNSFWGAVRSLFVEVLEQIVLSLASQHWYDVSGLIPQIIVLALTDIAVLSFMSVSINIVLTFIKRLRGVMSYSQASINEAYMPPDFTLGDRWAPRRLARTAAPPTG